ncbi:AAA family ATPase [Sulfuriflexus mobilis]|uniref:bifunctional aminoglycoside phosphotransferase/ATP-binding protein n=1 Tax=Sulfuriflexus mobilis TaxID=1811807 RepID=UPI000F82C026|nr:bifunctional aminoglycoside phosphotransferase/ATP-binding protein [Sulfuriflexus mobilis]
MNTIQAQQPALIRSMMQPALYGAPVEKCQLIETHISWVILTGPYAYKIKKPVNLGFLDFSTLEKRHLYCDEEVRLNRRLAADIYLEVVPITGSAEQPCLAGKGEVIEYAVKMLEFPQQIQLDRLLDAGGLQGRHIDAIATMIADFHNNIAVADKSMVYGSPERILKPVVENFTHIREQLGQQLETYACSPILDALQQWSEKSFRDLRPLFAARKDGGYIRECHGDLHLRNLAWIADAPLAFDCIEFNPDLRWIDVISEVAFLTMDLQARQQPGLAQRFLNAYLEKTGDYAGVRVLPFYLLYRAMVRAKVDAIRACQAGITDEEKAEAEEGLADYLRLGQSSIQPRSPRLMITRGMSASGKTSLTQPLLEALAALRIRSDVERKRLFGIEAEQAAHAETGAGIYTAEATQRTYNKLAELAGDVIDAGYPVIIDATFQKYEQRERFRQLAEAKKVPYVILEFTASAETLRQRIVSREKGASDADLAVLEQQMKHWQPLRDDEHVHALKIDTETAPNMSLLAEQVARMA